MTDRLVEVYWPGDRVTLEPGYIPEFDEDLVRSHRFGSVTRVGMTPLAPIERDGVHFWLDAEGNWHGARGTMESQQ